MLTLITLIVVATASAVGSPHSSVYIIRKVLFTDSTQRKPTTKMSVLQALLHREGRKKRTSNSLMWDFENCGTHSQRKQIKTTFMTNSLEREWPFCAAGMSANSEKIQGRACINCNS